MTKHASATPFSSFDDSPDALAMLTDALNQWGATVLVSISGRQALDLVERITPDLILLDAVMPDLDGFETCRRLKAMPALAGTPIIFMTGLSETAHVVKGLEAGGVDYVTKPLKLDELRPRAFRLHLANARVARSTRAALDTVGRHLFGCRPNGPDSLGARRRRSHCLDLATAFRTRRVRLH